MKSHGRSVVTTLLFAGAFALTSCGGGDSSSNSPPGGSVFAPGTSTPLSLTPGTGTTVSGQLVNVRLGTDNLVQSDPPLNRKLWVAVVSDAITGAPVAGVTVNFNLVAGTALYPGGYLKGSYQRPAPSPAPPAPPIPQVWTQTISTPVPSASTPCPNEDANHNGALDPLEDRNGNGLLDPPGVSDVNLTGISDSSGFARALISYPKNYASWAQVTLLASAGGGTPAQANFYLDGLASDYSDLTISPPGQISPFGQSAVCTNPF
jgi:hypothetical protein